MTRKRKEFTSKQAQELWNNTLEQFQLDAHDLELLRAAADCIDRIETAKEILARDGDYIRDRYNQVKTHPAMKTLNESKVTLARLLRELQLTSADDGRLPRA